MCRLFAVTSDDPVSPMVAIDALDIMREGHDGSGVGLYLTDLSGPFESMKDAPILSGIFTNNGLKRLDRFMMELGFVTMQHSMLDRAMDMTVRDIRLGTGTAPQHDDIKDMICARAGFIPDCDTSLRRSGTPDNNGA